MKSKDIAIVGMSCYAPGALSVDEFWNNLVKGVDSITDAPADRIDPRYFEGEDSSVDRFYCKRGGFVPEITFDPMPYSILPVAVEGMDTAHLLALKMAYKALEDAAVFEKKISLNKCALIIGKGNYVGSAIWRAIDIIHVGEQIAEVVKAAMPGISNEEIDKIKKAYQASRGRYQADSMPGLIPNLIASLIANKLDMQGPAYTIDAACASSLIALEHAVNEIHSGRCDIALAGGVHAGQNATFWSIFTQLGAMSRKQKIAPFNEDADGLLIGEGGGFVVLKSLEKAIADNDRVYAVIKGIGVSSDGSGISVMAPAVKGQKLAIERAWENAGIDRTKLGYVEAHGTATVVGDQTELNSLDSVFPKKENANEVLLGSVKSNVGHAMPAAGILGLIKATLALYNKQIPPTLHCENPLKEMKDTRFRPVQELVEWDENKYPLVAGVNAFGFGGINAHVILTNYENKRITGGTKKKPFIDKVIALSAATKEELINKLRKGEKSSVNNEGKHRIVIFDPTPERIEKAVKLIEKDIVWKGRQDIWYTNEPLLKNGGKIAYMYPGFDPAHNPEVSSIIDYFGFDMPVDYIENNFILEHTLKLYRKSEVLNSALKELNIKADVNIGHSMGEWFGIKSSGMVSDHFIREMLESLDPEKYKIDGIYFIALGCGKDRAKKYLDSIPDLYLSNDNCPTQALLCGTKEAVDKLLPELQKEQILYQPLTFQSGFHTPFIKDKMDLLEECFSHLKFDKPEVPMWSCNSLEVYPTDPQEIKALSVKHLLETVRFRELTEKLYNQENVRVFVQVGAGNLVGFVDDTLARKPYAAISVATSNRNTIEQLRRLLALLYIEGRNVDMNFLNVEEPKKTHAAPRKELTLKMKMDILTKFPLISELSEKYNHGTPLLDTSSLSLDVNHPIILALNENIQEMAKMQIDIVKLFQSKGKLGGNLSKDVQHKTHIQQSVAIEPQKKEILTTVAERRTGKKFEEDLYVSLQTHPTVIDHSLVKQPSYWTCVEDLNPVIPMTMTFELLVEAAHKQDLSKKVLQLGPVSVYQWMDVDKPFVKKITGIWKSEDRMSLDIKNFASGEVTIGDSFPKPDPFYANDIDLGETIRELPTKEEIYKSYMFHGPAYQTIEKVTDVTEKGIRTYIHAGEGKGSLLDNMGQSYGLYLHLMLDVNYISFPVKVQEITFYQDMHDQSGIFECVCLSKTITDEFTTCEMVLRREGKLWCVVKGWQNRRFTFDDILWQMTLNPGRKTLAKEIAPSVFHYYKAYEKQYCWNFLVKRYLNQPEKKKHESIPLNKRKEYVISRIALKDALRTYIAEKYDKTTYPIEYFVKYDSYNKPYVYGLEEVEGLEISIAHKGTDSVCIVSDKPVGIDMETIAERSEGFIDISFTHHEKELLKNRDNAEWSTRFWVAKEAYSKKLGLGLQGNPKRYEVKSVIGDNHLIIEDCEVEMMKYQNFIIGWTK